MRKVLAAFFACVVLGGAPSASAWPIADTSEAPDDNASLPNAWSVHDREHTALGQIAERLRQGDTNYAAIAQHLRVVVEDTAFSTLIPAEQHYAWLAYAGALFNSGQFALARPAIRRASEMPQAGPADWEFRLNDSFALQDYADAARAASRLARNWPGKLAHHDDRVFASLIAETRKNPDTADLATELLAALAAAHWRTSEGS
ncbi:MAG TPA: hypothetical protein VII56_12590 [Rhizomicrobium sp.]